MRIPRPRFTIRRMMIAVAAVAIALALGIPVAGRLYWLYHYPQSVDWFAAGVEFRPINNAATSPSRPRWNAPFPIGQPVATHWSYHCEALPMIPSGLIYRVTVAAKVVDARTMTIVESHQRSHLLIAGVESWKGVRRDWSNELLPRRPGDYMVRYEVRTTDMFGRTASPGLHTDGFTAR